MIVRRIFALAVVMVLMTTIRATAHRGDRVYPVYEIPSSSLPVIEDGELLDWEAALSEPSLVSGDFESVAMPSDLSDFAVRVFLAWHAFSQRIYVGIQYVDDVLVNWFDGETNSSSMVNYDLALVLVDGDHSGGPYASDFPTVGYQAQQYRAMPATPRGNILTQTGRQHWAETQDFMDFGVGVVEGTPTSVTMEMYLTPWDLLHSEGFESSQKSQLRSGQIIGLNLMFYDNDGSASGIEGVHAIAGTFSDGNIGGQLLFTADAFADAELVPCHVEDCADTRSVVGPSSWALIKAGLVP